MRMIGWRSGDMRLFRWRNGNRITRGWSRSRSALWRIRRCGKTMLDDHHIRRLRYHRGTVNGLRRDAEVRRSLKALLNLV